MNFKICSIFICLCVIVSGHEEEEHHEYGNQVPLPVYKLTSGSFKAESIHISDKIVYKLTSVPYARLTSAFAKSEEILSPNKNDKMSGDDASSRLCIQPYIFHNMWYGNFKLPHEFNMAMNCLTLNVYIPKSSGSGSKSAMLYIHGGSNAAGSGSFIDPTALSAYGDVIVVMPNYRLDVLGFLSVQSLSSNHSSDFKGNYGLWDQTMAIKWLRSNCHALGCLPESLTVFGHSAGSSDAMLLALSPNARPYIKRIILQSGSALAHWASLQEKHLFEKLSQEHTKNKSLLVKYLNVSRLKYVNSMNHTVSNFLSYSSCNLTRKHHCFVNKIRNFYLALDGDNNTNSSIMFSSILEKLDLDEFIGLFGYFHKTISDTLSREAFFSSMTSTELTPDKINELKELNKRRHGHESRLKSLDEFLARHNPKIQVTSEILSKFENPSTCFQELISFMPNPASVRFVCDLLPKDELVATLLSTDIARYFMECFKIYYHHHSHHHHHHHEIDLNQLILVKESDLVLREMKTCLDQMIRMSHDEINYENQEALIVRDMTMLTENSNYIHRPTLDYEFFTQSPHSSLSLLSDLDIMMGATIHESFFFLFHDYNINDILTHAFIHSSLLNSTQNLIAKLTEFNRNRKLNFCLKRHLFNYYGLEMSDADLAKNSLKNITSSLELISDYDFILPIITYLKHYLDHRNTNNLYVFEYAHFSSFNYLLDFMRNYNLDFDSHLVKLNKSAVPHFSELDFVFGLPMLSKYDLIKAKNVSASEFLYNYTEPEYLLSKKLISYWTNFAKYGNPNEKSDQAHWLNFNSTTPSIFRIETSRQFNDVLKIKRLLDKHAFWYERLPNELFDQCFAKHSPYRKLPHSFDQYVKWNSQGGVNVRSNPILLVVLIISCSLSF